VGDVVSAADAEPNVAAPAPRGGSPATHTTEQAAAVAAARAGDEAAFAGLVEAYRRELQVHCYRMLGSFEESEDLVQETFLRAWRWRGSFQGRSTFRAWLYRIATNACLDHLRQRQRRPVPRDPAAALGRSAAGMPHAEIPWLQPFPDRLMEPAAPRDDEPDAAAVARETIELAFMVAIQHLPPRQRAVLILRDVLGWSANETAALLDTSVAAVKSALQRARPALRAHLPERRGDWVAADPTEEERALLQRYMDAHQRADLDTVARLVAEDVLLTMPPHPQWLVGRDALLGFTAQVFDPGSSWYLGQWRSVVTRANRQPAVAHYVERPDYPATRDLPGRYRAQVLDVLRIEGGQVAEITAFEPRMFPAFGLPLAL
jgi:RNA polymerase sigma-70 factor (ECF subfamily)